MAQVTFSNQAFLEAIEGATIICGDINESEGVTLHLADGRALIFVSDCFGLMLKRVSMEKLH
jgi:hypothetical protein